MKKTSSNQVAFVIVGWNNRPLLKECFDSIFKQTYRQLKVVYVDNFSQDGSVNFVKNNYPQAIVIEVNENSGFAKGNNLGIAEALKDPSVNYVALVNTDARLAPGWSEHIIKFAQLKPRGALYQGTTMDYYNHKIIDSTHIYVAHNGQGTQGNWRYYEKGEFGPKKVFGVNAAACMISRAFLEAQPFGTEVFDETMFMYLEDIDLSVRATILGWDNYLVPAARAFHMGSASSGKNPGYSLYMTFRNNGAALFKNLPLGMLLRMLPKIIRGDFDTYRELRRRRKTKAGWKVLKGRLVGFLRWPLFVSKRWRLQRRFKIDKNYLWRLMDRGY